MDEKIILAKKISEVAWNSLLKRFSDAVNSKFYKRIPYDVWRKVSKLKDEIKFQLELRNYNIWINVCHGETYSAALLDVFDESLGQFLFHDFLTMEERIMAYDCSETAKVADKIISESGWLAYSESIEGRNATAAISANEVTSTIDIANIKTAIGNINDIKLANDGTYYTDNIYSIDGAAAKSIKYGSSLSVSQDSLYFNTEKVATIDDVKKIVTDKIDENNKVKEMENKKMKGFNFDFGPCTGDFVRMSMYGLAVKNAAGTYVSYNPKNGEIVDVDVLNFDGAKFMYKIPVAVKDVAIGDIIVHNSKPMFVTALPAEGANAITCVDVCAGEQKQVIPTVNMFGFNFITKIVSLFNTINNNAPTPDAPFGNMLPFMLMSEGREKIDPMMMMFMMGSKVDMNNPMMMYFMMKDNKDSDMLPFLFMMNSNK